MAMTRMQAIEELLDAEDELGRAWDDLTTWVTRDLEGHWGDPESMVTHALRRMRLATGAANAALDQAIAKGGE